MSQNKVEKMISAWIGNEASYMESELPGETGLFDFSLLVASRVLRGFAAGADRFCFEVDAEEPALWECINETAPGGAPVEPASDALLKDLWDAHASLHEEHRIVPDTPPWLKVKEDTTKAKVVVGFGEEERVGTLAEVVSAGAYHLVLNGARRVLVELGREYAVVMTPERVSQEAVERSFDETEIPENLPLRALPPPAGV